MIDASIKGQADPLTPLSANPFQRLGGTSKQAAENADWARNAPTRVEAVLILDVLRGAEAPHFRVTGTSRSVPFSFHHVGLWIGVGMKGTCCFTSEMLRFADWSGLFKTARYENNSESASPVPN